MHKPALIIVGAHVINAILYIWSVRNMWQVYSDYSETLSAVKGKRSVHSRFAQTVLCSAWGSYIKVMHI